MFISKLGCPERKETDSLTSKCRFKDPRIHELCLLLLKTGITHNHPVITGNHP